MTDQPPFPPAGAPRGPESDDTQPVRPTTGQPTGHPFGQPLGPPPPPLTTPMPPAAASAAPAPTASGRGRFAAMVVAASLVVGGAAGVGGAAAWNAFDDDPASPSPSTSSFSPTKTSDDAPVTDGSVQSVADKVLPSVVKIDVSGSQGSGSGSGVVISSDGKILTNDHVVEVAAEGGTISVSFSDGTRAKARILGTDSLTDLAVIQAEDVKDLTAAEIGSSSELKVGEPVVAVGSPFGLDATVTSGIVSALNRPVGVGSDQSGNTTAYPAIQTDAAINPGNSGGPLVDMQGRVVGINSSIRTTGSSSPFGGQSEGGSIGLGFAIPIDAAMPIVEQIIDGEEPTHARLGITVSNVASNDTGRSEGALVREVTADSAAAKAGLEADDVIVKIDGHQITSADSLIATVRSYRPGDTVSVTFRRDGEERTADLELGSDAAVG
ncbi:PDZ domain-containing protein [Nocardioides sp. dk4132]|uniref:S1C family serine protease n=1 Tax=unclassified Nocardioides TaxID=2615069 RepID=UPI001297126A|nr:MULTISPECIES: trypsin-like peptidase domain-containing protein [unclassified Nocardioides]MQW76036.1 PDZ domain-containing protein [Nocardioides sp. dk4132]QGA08887.1 PDZ domain-containing protein [Nocardioides sp. dk884]